MRNVTMFEDAKEALGYDTGDLLRPTDSGSHHPENPEDLSSVSEWLALEKAKRLHAHYVYFRRFEGRPSQPLFYVYDYTEDMGLPNESELVLLWHFNPKVGLGVQMGKRWRILGWEKKLIGCCWKYAGLFKVYRRGNADCFGQYLCGLFHEGRHNIERMVERIEGSDYDRLHHFISESPWGHAPVLQAVGRGLSALFVGRAGPVALIVDESGHRKSGDKSVGVARQYLGGIGKTDNGQVGVFAALAQGDDVGMVDVKLCLPKEWADSPKRCAKAGIPTLHQKFKTKPRLALEMIENLEGIVHCDWVGGDGAYGGSSELRKGIAALGRTFVLDVHENQLVHLGRPRPHIPDGPAGQGGKKNTYKSEKQEFMVKDLLPALPDGQWKTDTYRRGTKGGKTRQVVCLDVYIWNKSRAKTDAVEQLRLIVSREMDGSEIKYSVTNDVARSNCAPCSEHQLLYRQMHRYWAERGIQDCKDTLGMTDYQVRTWRAWHRHITLTIMALHFMIEQKVAHEIQMPLLSCPDIKFFLAINLPRKVNNEQQAWEIIKKRHLLRQKDLDRWQT